MKFNLAMDGNNVNLKCDIQKSLDINGSRLLDSLYIDSQRPERQTEIKYEQDVALG